MMRSLPLGDIARAIGAQLPGGCDPAQQITEISSDTRTIVPGSLFVAIEGERFDGHAYVQAAFDKGAAAAVVARPVERAGGPQLVCQNTKNALIAMGGLYRDLFESCRFVAVTGSVGKTTTKEMIYAALRRFGKTLKTEGNQNNEIGMPATLFRLQDDTRLAVIEMGMSGFGEIAPMTRAVRPEVAVVTNIGVSHLEAMGTRENILHEKLDIALGLQGPKTLVLCSDNDLLSTVTQVPGADHILRYAIADKSADFVAGSIHSDRVSTFFTVHCKEGDFPVQIPCLGQHNVLNALAAIAVSAALGLSVATAAAGCADYQPAGMRQRLVQCGDITFIEDCYNASPDSMRASITLLAQNFPGRRKIAVLADMLELGEHSQQMHRDVGQMLCDNGIDCAFLYGPQMLRCAETATAGGVEVRHFADKPALTAAVIAALAPGDCVLVKGSRGMKLEEVLEEIYHTNGGTCR